MSHSPAGMQPHSAAQPHHHTGTAARPRRQRATQSHTGSHTASSRCSENVLDAQEPQQRLQDVSKRALRSPDTLCVLGNTRCHTTSFCVRPACHACGPARRVKVFLRNLQSARDRLYRGSGLRTLRHYVFLLFYNYLCAKKCARNSMAA